VLQSRPGGSYQAGDFVPIEMAKDSKQRQLLASLHVHGHFKVQGLAVFYANCLATLARSERINTLGAERHPSSFA